MSYKNESVMKTEIISVGGPLVNDDVVDMNEQMIQ